MFHPGQAFAGRAHQTPAFGRGLQRNQGLEQAPAFGHGLACGCKVVGAGLPLLAAQPLKTLPRQQVAQVLVDLDRRAAVGAFQRTAEPVDGGVKSAGGGIGHAKGLGHRTHVAPDLAVFAFQEADARQLSFGRAAFPFGAHGQGLQRGGQAQRRRNAGVDVVQRHHGSLGVTGAGAQAPVRVAITLVSGPGVAAHAPGQVARFAHGVAKGLAGQQALVEANGKGLGGFVFHRPAGRDHAAHANADQLLGHAGGKAGGLEVAGFAGRAADGRQVAAVDKHQLGHRAHGGNFIGPQKGFARQHHTALGGSFTVPADVQDAPGAFEQRVDDGPGALFVQRLHTARAHGPLQQVTDRLGFGQRGVQRPVVGAVDEGLADDQHRVVGNGVGARRHLVVLELHLAQHAAAQRPGARVHGLAVGRCVQQLPGDGGRAHVQLQQQPRGAAQVRLDAGGHQQLKQRAAQLRVAVGVGGGGLDQLFHQRHLRALLAQVVAGAAAVQRKLHHAGAAADHADEVVVGAAVAGVQRPAQAAGAKPHRIVHVVSVLGRGLQALQFAPGLAGAVQVQLHQLQARNQGPRRVVAALVGLKHALVGVGHALGDGPRRRAGRDAKTAAAQQRGGHLHRAFAAVARLLFGAALQPAQHRLAHRRGQCGFAQLALFTQPHHHHRRRLAQARRHAGVAQRVHKHLVRAGRFGVEIGVERQRGAHGAANQVVDHTLGAGQGQRLVVPHQQGVAHERQVAVDHADRQLALGRSTGCRVRRGRGVEDGVQQAVFGRGRCGQAARA